MRLVPNQHSAFTTPLFFLRVLLRVLLSVVLRGFFLGSVAESLAERCVERIFSCRVLLRVLLSVVLRGGPNVGGGHQYLALMERGIVLRVCGEPCGEHCPIIKQTSLQSLRRLRSRRCPSCLARLASAQGRPLPRQLNGPNRPAILQGRLPRPLARQCRGWLRRKQSSRRQGGALLTPRHLRPSRWLPRRKGPMLPALLVGLRPQSCKGKWATWRLT